MMIENVKFIKLLEGAEAPNYGSECAAGADLYACNGGKTLRIEPGETALIHTGLAVQIPDGLVGMVFARSGIATKRGLAPANKVGIIDSDYRGELMVPIFNQSGCVQEIADGERVAQLVLTPYVHAVFEETDTLCETARADRGFGSTGTK